MKPKISDIILISVLLIGVIISAIFIYMPKNYTNKNLYAIVEIDNEVVEEIDFKTLTEETTYVYQGLITEIVVKADSDGLWVSKSGCKTQQCVKHKKITNAGETIFCAYNIVEVKILER